MTNEKRTDEGADKYLTAALEKIRGKLLDKTRRNRLLNYKESGRDIAIIDEMPDQVHEHLRRIKSGEIRQREPIRFLRN